MILSLLSEELVLYRHGYLSIDIIMQFVYENEDPSQSLKMLSEKLDITGSEQNNLIFPTQHVKDTYCDKHLSLFFLQDFVVPLRFY